MKRVLMLASFASMIDQFNMPNIVLLQKLGYEVDVACNFIEGNTCSDAHMHVLQFLFQFRDARIRAGISFNKIAGHIYLIPQFLQQCNVWHIKLIDH